MIIKRSAMFFASYQATTLLDIKLKYYWWEYSRWCKTTLVGIFAMVQNHP